jgi:hypothetical protein
LEKPGSRRRSRQSLADQRRHGGSEDKGEDEKPGAGQGSTSLIL